MNIWMVRGGKLGEFETIAIEKCHQDVPEWREVVSGHWVACHLV